MSVWWYLYGLVFAWHLGAGKAAVQRVLDEVAARKRKKAAADKKRRRQSR